MYRPGGKNSSVRYGNQTRFNKAREQRKLTPKSIDDVINCVNEYLFKNNIPKVSNPILELDNGLFKEDMKPSTFYKELQSAYCLKDKRDLVWIKFTNEMHIVAVAVGADINVRMPSSKKDYQNRKFNTAGIIVYELDETYDKEFVLVFPLSDLPDNVKRGHVEKGIGDYLIENQFPILDYYSHRY